tara:strand:+ start:699 stop:899 length:201 start_codon:yes stop_codon:yes gene_type:complete
MVESPCNDICQVDPKSGLCVGCGRTNDEIANWSIYTDEQKKSILRELKLRNNIDTQQPSVLKTNNE